MIEEFNKYICISVTTSNNNGTGSTDILPLWQRFYTEVWSDKIVNKAHDSIVCIYHNYSGDHNGTYSASIGYAVSSFDSMPEGAVAIEVPKCNYKRYLATGNLHNGCVFAKWQEIWKEDDQHRLYQYDFEVYDPALDPTNAEVPIYIGVK